MVQGLRDDVARGLVALEFKCMHPGGLIEAKQVDAPAVSGMDLSADDQQRLAEHRRVAHDELFEFVFSWQLRDCNARGGVIGQPP